MTVNMLPIANLLDLGRAFRRERRSLGKTQAEVASAALLRRETIIRIEAGENVDAVTLLKAITALGKGIAIVDSRPSYDELGQLFNED